MKELKELHDASKALTKANRKVDRALLKAEAAVSRLYQILDVEKAGAK